MIVVAASGASWLLRGGLAIAAMLMIYLVGAGIIRKFHVEPEAEPDPADLVPVDYRFRCQVCGAEVTMTAAQTADEPEAPRHCREDMLPIDSRA